MRKRIGITGGLRKEETQRANGYFGLEYLNGESVRRLGNQQRVCSGSRSGAVGSEAVGREKSRQSQWAVGSRFISDSPGESRKLYSENIKEELVVFVLRVDMCYFFIVYWLKI